MDGQAITNLAQMATSVLLPHLPALANKASEGAAGELGKRALGGAWERARKLWDLLRPSMQSSPALERAVSRASRAPDDPDVVAALRLELSELIEAEPALRMQVAELLPGSSSTVVNVHGDRSVGIGGHAVSSNIQTGDVLPQ